MPAQKDPGMQNGRGAEDKALELVLLCTMGLFRNRKTLTERCFDRTMKMCKTVVRRTNNDENVRHILGNNVQHWKDMHDTFALAIPVLEVQSLTADVPQPGAPTSSSALMALNHDTLMKDLERLNDILLVARNLLASTNRVQNIAGESLLDQQVLKLIDLCVRVTARGYDGDTGNTGNPGNRHELQWGNVIGACAYSNSSLV